MTRVATALLFVLASLPALVDAATVRIASAFSTQAGGVQFVQLERIGDSPWPNRDLLLETFDSAQRWLTAVPVPFDAFPAERRTYVLAFDDKGVLRFDDYPPAPTSPDALVSQAFVSRSGGTLTLSGSPGAGDTWTYAALPDDGRSMLDRDKGVVPASFDNGRDQPVVVDLSAAGGETQCKNHYILDEPCPPPTAYRIAQLYSNLDGSEQYIELVAEGDGPRSLAGRTLTSVHDGVVKSFTFPNDVPDVVAGADSIVVATVPRLLAEHFGAGGNFVVSFRPHYVVPARFLATEGGTLSLGEADTFEHAQLPGDGASALYRDGHVDRGRLVPDYCRTQVPPPVACSTPYMPMPHAVRALEYVDTAQHDYFFTASASEIEALDSGRVPGWQRTGEALEVGAGPTTYLGLEWTYGASAVCRIYLPAGAGGGHFYSASPDECAAVLAKDARSVLEGAAAFYAALPDPVTGECGVLPGFIDGDIGLVPVYRLWNGQVDSSHRFTTRVDLRADMISRGWIPEGYGPLGVAMCVLPDFG